MTRLLHSSFGLALCLAMTACGDDTGQGSSNVVDDGPQGQLHLMVTVDWEGRELADDDLEAMRAMRERFEQVPLVHFLNAAYFTKPDADAEDVRQRTASVLRDGDELGLHIHGWLRLFEAAGVAFRNEPTFWGGAVSSYQCSYDCGQGVAISAYEREELQQVIRFSVETLDSYGFGRAVSFRAGGWMAPQHVREAVAAEGLTVDSSAVAAYFLEDEIGDAPLYEWVAELWAGIDATSQPYPLDGLTEIPDNGALADYVTANEMFAVYLDAKQRLADAPEQDVVVNIGFHQETARDYLYRVEDALERMLADAHENDVPLQPTTMLPWH
jgi:hypothetical protein